MRARVSAMVIACLVLIAVVPMGIVG